MKFDRGFAEILEDLNPSSRASSVNAGWESSLEPAGISQILAQVPVFKTGYKRYKSSPRPSHIMTVEQRIAFENLSIWSPLLKDNFNRFELKSFYRQALLKTHPDQGGTSERFFGVKKSYEILRSLVTS